MAEKKINGETYKVEPLLAMDAIALYTDIMRVAGKAANRLPAIIIALSTPDEGQQAMADVAALAAIADILRDTPTEQVQDLVRRIASVAMIRQPSGTYREVDIDGDFTGNLKSLLPLCRFVVTEQFSDFFIGSGGNGILSMFRDSLQTRK